jgi:hypothetical protein
MPRLFLSRNIEMHRPPGSTHVVCQSWGAAVAQFDPAHLHRRHPAPEHADAATDHGGGGGTIGGAPGVSTFYDDGSILLRFPYVTPVLIRKY